MELGIPHGGWCPLGRLAEDGRIPDRYHLTETFSANYAIRTNRNVVDSDGTVVFTLSGPPAKKSGSELTVKLSKDNAKPCLIIDLSLDPDTARRLFLDWLSDHRIAVLNVAGSRESESPGIAAGVRKFLMDALVNCP